MVKQGEKEIMGGKLSKQTGRLQMRERFEPAYREWEIQ